MLNMKPARPHTFKRCYRCGRSFDNVSGAFTQHDVHCLRRAIESDRRKREQREAA